MVRWASPDLRSDRAIVVAAVKQSGEALKHASEELQSDRIEYGTDWIS